MYASGDGLDVLLIEREVPGGQAGSSPKIENFLGFPAGISGQDLTRRALTQAQRLGAEFLTTHAVDSVRLEGDTKIVKLSDGTEISAKIILIATGAWFRKLEIPAMETLERRRRLLRRRPHGGGELQGHGRGCNRRRQLGGAGHPLPQQVRAQHQGPDPRGRAELVRNTWTWRSALTRRSS